MQSQVDSAVPPTIVVGLHGTCWLYPEGTTYGGGPASYRDPDADPVDDTPVRTVEQALAELGDVGTALRWARERGLVNLNETERREAEDSSREPLDALDWDAGMSLEQWREFAGLYLIEIGADGRPVGAEETGETDVWQVFSNGMEWNVGGITRVDHTDLEIAFDSGADR
jgi:hypothetical protein